MKLTRRDFLKGGAITAAALAVGLKPKAIETRTRLVELGTVTEFTVNGVDMLGKTVPITLGDFAQSIREIRTAQPQTGYWIVNQDRLRDILDYIDADECYKSPLGTLFGYPIIWTENVT
jgi:hypothetical protein